MHREKQHSDLRNMKKGSLRDPFLSQMSTTGHFSISNSKAPLSKSPPGSPPNVHGPTTNNIHFVHNPSATLLNQLTNTDLKSVNAKMKNLFHHHFPKETLYSYRNETQTTRKHIQYSKSQERVDAPIGINGSTYFFQHSHYPDLSVVPNNIQDVKQPFTTFKMAYPKLIQRLLQKQHEKAHGAGKGMLSYQHLHHVGGHNGGKSYRAPTNEFTINDHELKPGNSDCVNIPKTASNKQSRHKSMVFPPSQMHGFPVDTHQDAGPIMTVGVSPRSGKFNPTLEFTPKETKPKRKPSTGNIGAHVGFVKEPYQPESNDNPKMLKALFARTQKVLSSYKEKELEWKEERDKMNTQIQFLVQELMQAKSPAKHKS